MKSVCVTFQFMGLELFFIHYEGRDKRARSDELMSVGVPFKLTRSVFPLHFPLTLML